MTKNKVPHPGWACCDLNQDLQAWLNREQAAVAIKYRWCAVLHTRGKRLDNQALTELIEGNHSRHNELSTASRNAHGRANAYGQNAMIRNGHAERVRDAHKWRL